MFIKLLLICIVTNIFLIISAKNENILIDGFRPPAVPLIVFSPHMSVWSPSNNLTDSYSAHWSGKQMDFVGMIRIDNITYRFMGSDQVKAPPMQQTQVIVNPWRTVYTFQSAGVQLTLAFSQPPALDDPYTYISFYLQSVDQKKHEAQLYFDMSAYIPINDPNEKVDWYDDLSSINSTQILTMFSFDQIAFRIRGDSEKNNWGYAHLIYDGREYPYTKTQASGQTSRQSFIDGQPLPANDKRKPRSASDNSSVSAYVINFGNVTGEQVESFLTFAYDDTYSMYYFNDYQVPYWRSQKNITMLANEAIRRYSTSMEDVSVLDSLVIQLLNKTAGEKYATLLSLVIRQITGAMTVTWSEKFQTTFLFMKEISSDGDVSTVDVIYPSSPMLLWLQPEILKGLLLPILMYANNVTDISYNLPWAPHHLGTWSVCDITPDEQEQMPMEESANMLLMLAGIVQRLKYNVDFLKPYWSVLGTWAQYLNSTLPDPGNQLCTDDFEGPSPHNVNLALKGILGLGAYSLLLNYSGQTEMAKAYMNDAKNYAEYWMTNARDSDNYRLQYDLPGTWSQKYNLVYQNILNLNLFPDSVALIESNYYQTKMLNYGVPLDSRSSLTKTDWQSWIAAFSTKEQQDTIINALYKYASETPDRVPLSDFYDASNAKVLGFRARPVMGGLFIRALLENPIIPVDIKPIFTRRGKE